MGRHERKWGCERSSPHLKRMARASAPLQSVRAWRTSACGGMASTPDQRLSPSRSSNGVPGSEVWAVEKSATTAEWTRRNFDETAKRYPAIAGNYHLDIADATQMPTLSQLDGTIDIVLTNPPYVPLADIPEQPEVRDYDPDLALYGGSADGTLIPERIIARAAKLLRAGGLMVMEHDITQGERLAAFARTCGFVDVTVHNDYTGRPRYLTAEKQPAQ